MISYFKRILRHISGAAGPPDERDPDRSITIQRSDLPKGFQYIRAHSLLNWKSFQSYEKIKKFDGQDTWFKEKTLPALVLFISHRWVNSDHPDPKGVQLKALQILIRAIASISTGKYYGVRKRRSYVPSLMEHGVLQAAVIVGAGHMAPDENNLPEWQYWSQMWSQAKGRMVSEECILNNVGVWYDFSCMPHDAVLLLREESTRNPELEENLSALHELVSCCPVIILRAENDGYEHRGWCAAELSIRINTMRHLVIRTDLLGSSFSTDDLLLPEDTEPDAFPGRKLFVGCLEQWSNGVNPFIGKKEASKPWSPGQVFGHFSNFAEIEEKRQIPLLTTKRKPDIFHGHMQLLLAVKNILEKASKADQQGQTPINIDLCGIVKVAMIHAGLNCTNMDDLVFTGLTILHARHVSAPLMAELFDAARKRFLEGKSMVLQRYREMRGSTDIKVWYLFDDEEFRDLPSWNDELQSQPDLSGNSVTTFVCRHQPQDALFYMRCTDCESVFCDLCMQDAASEVEELIVLTSELTQFPMRCPHCGSSKLETTSQ